MSTIYDPALESRRADDLAQIDSDCADCRESITTDGDFHFYRSREAEIDFYKGGVFIPHDDDPTEPVAAELRISETLFIDDGESPLKALIELMEGWVRELRKAGGV